MMDEQRLQEIERWANALTIAVSEREDVRALIAEVRRLRERQEDDTVLLGTIAGERDAALARAERLAHDIHAYRGALGYPVPGNHDGRLSDGTTPTCGLCDAVMSRAERAERERDERAPQGATEDCAGPAMTRMRAILRRVLCRLRDHAGVSIERHPRGYVVTCKRCGATWKV